MKFWKSKDDKYYDDRAVYPISLGSAPLWHSGIHVNYAGKTENENLVAKNLFQCKLIAFRKGKYITVKGDKEDDKQSNAFCIFEKSLKEKDDKEFKFYLLYTHLMPSEFYRFIDVDGTKKDSVVISNTDVSEPDYPPLPFYKEIRIKLKSCNRKIRRLSEYGYEGRKVYVTSPRFLFADDNDSPNEKAGFVLGKKVRVDDNDYATCYFKNLKKTDGESLIAITNEKKVPCYILNDGNMVQLGLIRNKQTSNDFKEKNNATANERSRETGQGSKKDHGKMYYYVYTKNTKIIDNVVYREIRITGKELYLSSLKQGYVYFSDKSAEEFHYNEELHFYSRKGSLGANPDEDTQKDEVTFMKKYFPLDEYENTNPTGSLIIFEKDKYTASPDKYSYLPEDVKNKFTDGNSKNIKYACLYKKDTAEFDYIENLQAEKDKYFIVMDKANTYVHAVDAADYNKILTESMIETIIEKEDEATGKITTEKKKECLYYEAGDKVRFLKRTINIPDEILGKIKIELLDEIYNKGNEKNAKIKTDSGKAEGRFYICNDTSLTVYIKDESINEVATPARLVDIDEETNGTEGLIVYENGEPVDEIAKDKCISVINVKSFLSELTNNENKEKLIKIENGNREVNIGNRVRRFHKADNEDCQSDMEDLSLEFELSIKDREDFSGAENEIIFPENSDFYDENIGMGEISKISEGYVFSYFDVSLFMKDFRKICFEKFLLPRGTKTYTLAPAKAGTKIFLPRNTEVKKITTLEVGGIKYGLYKVIKLCIYLDSPETMVMETDMYEPESKKTRKYYGLKLSEDNKVIFWLSDDHIEYNVKTKEYNILSRKSDGELKYSIVERIFKWMFGDVRNNNSFVALNTRVYAQKSTQWGMRYDFEVSMADSTFYAREGSVDEKSSVYSQDDKIIEAYFNEDDLYPEICAKTNIEKDEICEGESVPIHCKENGRIVSKYKATSKNGDFLADEAVAKRDCLRWEEFEKVKSDGLFYSWDMLSNLSFANEVFQKKILQKARNLTDDFADVACIHPMEFDRELYDENVTRRLSLYIKGSNYEDTKDDLDIFQGIKGKIKETKNGKEVANQDFNGDNLFCFYHPITFLKKLDDAGIFEFNPYEDNTDDLPTIVGEEVKCEVRSNPGFAPYIGQEKYHGYASITGHFNEWYGSYYHEGTDFAGECEKTPIKALVSGKVVLAKDQGDLHYGLSLLIKGDRQEDGKNLFYLIAHLSRYETGIEEGSTVSPGQTVGYVGNSGNCYTAGHKVSHKERAAGKGAHLHLSVYKTGKSKGEDLFTDTYITKYKVNDKWKSDMVNPFDHKIERRF